MVILNGLVTCKHQACTKSVCKAKAIVRQPE